MTGGAFQYVDFVPSGALYLDIDVKAIYHDLEGSGCTSAKWEYPVTVLVHYIDTDGILRYLQYGWYRDGGVLGSGPLGLHPS